MVGGFIHIFQLVFVKKLEANRNNHICRFVPKMASRLLVVITPDGILLYKYKSQIFIKSIRRGTHCLKILFYGVQINFRL